jgi:hypothetical protein
MDPEQDADEGKWKVIFHPEFESEFDELQEDVQDELLAVAVMIKECGPEAKRPRVDTLNGSKYANMKELRFDAGDGVWRAAFAFDPDRRAIVLVAGDKSGVSEKRFYKVLIEKADARFGAHLKLFGKSEKVKKKPKKGKRS